MMRLPWHAAAVVLALTGAGCAQPRVGLGDFQRMSLNNVSSEIAFGAAERALREHFQIAVSSLENGMLRTRPVESVAAVDPERVLSDAFGTRQRVRRIAEVRLRPAGTAIEVHCKVLVLHSETAAARALIHNRGVYDQPTETPADRDAGFTEEQNAVWVIQARDRAMERQILASIREILDESGG